MTENMRNKIAIGGTLLGILFTQPTSAQTCGGDGDYSRINPAQSIANTCKYPDSMGNKIVKGTKIYYCCGPDGTISRVYNLEQAIRSGVLPGMRCDSRLACYPPKRNLCC